MRTSRRFFLTQSFALLAFMILGLLCVQPRLQARAPRAGNSIPFFSQTALYNQATDKARTLGDDPAVPLWEHGCGVASLAMVFRTYGVDTDIVRLNETLRQTGGFSGALLAWDKGVAFQKAGSPWIQGIEKVNTTRPQDYQQRVDAELDAGHPVIAFLGNRHYVVLTGKEDSDGYLINDPWALTAADGQGIPLARNALKLKFGDIRQFVFVYPDRNAPTNGIPVRGAIGDKYYSLGGARGSLGQPQAEEQPLFCDLGFTSVGRWQPFEHGAILVVADSVYALHSPLWEKYLSVGLRRLYSTTSDTERPALVLDERSPLGWPVADDYTYFVGSTVEWRADFAGGSILWTEGDRLDRIRVLTAENGIRAEYFPNSDLAGNPVYTRFEESLLFTWQLGAPGPWVTPDGFSARYLTTMKVGGLGWFYNFVVDADDGARLFIDDQLFLDGWAGTYNLGQVRRWVSGGNHALKVEYRELKESARLQVAYSAWPIKPVFAGEEGAQSFEFLPAPADEPEAVPVPGPSRGPGASWWETPWHNLTRQIEDWWREQRANINRWWEQQQSGAADRIEQWWRQQWAKVQRQVDQWLHELEQQAAEEMQQRIEEFLSNLCSVSMLPVGLAVAAWVKSARRHKERR